MAAVESNRVVVFKGKTHGDFIYEDEICVAFEVEGKQAPVHFVVVPKKIVPSLCDATDEDEILLGHMLLVAKSLASDRGLAHGGFHTVVDENHRTRRLEALHVFGRALMHMLWPTSLSSS
ncbi:adenosine 5'-monophosphoramidase HINT2-like isoform X1 [Amyelois transitella]|uniref:adenosine 5'-monophosphoramidase HINT2-like isoform X1 n=1 Tax=Amyelois transitella TaxID=680683 RepID=UPI00067B990E|nr:adenosine 5'-monophosphoramidase HINT2-like isoform X1 [Amyelois transitella]